MVKYCELFITFLKVGTFTIGGGYAMIPLMQREVVERRRWMDAETFLDVLSLSQAMPGVFAVNMATQVGYRLRGVRGSAAAIAGNVLMPIALVLLIAIFFRRFKGAPAVEQVFMGLRPAVAALIAAPVFTLARSARIGWSNCWIPLAAALLIWLLGVSPIIVVLAAAAAGWLWGRAENRNLKTKQ